MTVLKIGGVVHHQGRLLLIQLVASGTRLVYLLVDGFGHY